MQLLRLRAYERPLGRISRQFGTSQLRRIAEVPPPAVAPKVKPKKRRFRRFLLGATTLVGIAYAGGVYFSLDNDEFYDFFTGMAPLGSDVVALVDDLLFRYTTRTATPVATKPKEQLAVRNQTVPVTAERSKVGVREYADAIPKEKPARPVPLDKASSNEAARAPVIAKEAPNSSSALPLLALKDVDSALESVVDKLNAWITTANKSAAPTTANVKDIAAALTEASHSITRLRESQSDLDDQERLRQYEEVRRAASAEIAASQDAFDADRRRLLDVANARLDKAVTATKEAVIAEANNLLTSQFIEQETEFTHEIQNRVEAEREGRLSKLDELSSDIGVLEKTLLSTGSAIADQDAVVSFFFALGSLDHALASGSDAVPVKPFLDRMTKALPNDPLIAAAIAAIPQDVKQYGVLSPAQLSARFQLLEPEIRRASLAPADAGVAGHISSLVASQLLVKKTGMPQGDDVESIVARTQTLLSQGRVVDAVAEANTLQGWSKKIAADWLTEARKRAELEFLVNVFAEEGKLHSLSRK